jgi:hypothetical protein
MERSTSPRPLVVLLVLAVLTTAAALLFITHRPATSVNSDSAAQAPTQPVVPVSSPAGSLPARTPTHVAEKSPGEIFGSLTNVDLSSGRLSSEQAAQLRSSFQTIALQGTAAIPTIQALLAGKADVKYGKGSGDSVGVPSFRLGLMETLRQIGGPEAVVASREALRSTSDPLEIAFLARNLEEAAPGQYSQEVLDTAMEVLDASAQGQLTNTDVGPLFQALQSMGSTNIASQFAALASKYGYYASLALAELPSGGGVAGLVQIAQDQSEAGIGNRQFAFQMLAQASAQSPDAGNALVDLARQNQVPSTAWGQIAAVLAGQQFQFPRNYPNSMFATVDGPEMRTFRQPNGNQNFISFNVPNDGISSGGSQRLALIDQLLAVTTDPGAVQALQQARARLAGPGAK